ncbi:MAG TPA: isoprenylcysteine carboxylmethyltransferase family protein [Rhizomicrobium sp.]|nr:isoprenylcysteine carboxylmethyltransferase family protein [Rhizomicrobium sp.]
MSGFVAYLSWPEAAIYIPWDIWIVTWIAAALWANRTVKTPGIGREIAYRILTLLGFVLLLFVQGQTSGDFLKGLHTQQPLLQRYWALPRNVGWVMVGLVSLGCLFAWWARIHLGRLWSGRITRKEGHKVVDTGPYAIVRHPIYTGLILAAFATAAEKGTPLAVIGALLFYVGYWMKARLEERFLREELGPKDYDAYRARVPMLIPFGPRSF